MNFAEYLCIDDFLGASANQTILDWALSNEDRFVPTVVGTGKTNQEIRVSSGLSDLGPSQALIRNAVKPMLPEFAGKLGLTSYQMKGFDAELVAHNDGAFYRAHNDIASSKVVDERTGKAGTVASTRLISAVYYFHREPKAYSGGELRLFPLIPAPGKEPIDIAPRNDMLLVFRAMSIHEVLRVSCPSGAFADSRFAINCWAHRSAPPKSG